MEKYLEYIKNIFFKLRYCFLGCKININGYDIYLDELLRRWKIDSELPALAIIKKIIKEEDVFIDIGAGFGLHTLYVANFIKKEERVYTFEPLESNIRLLKRNIALNKLGKCITVIPTTLSNQTNNTLDFYIPRSKRNVCMVGSLAALHRQGISIKVRNMRLDDYWQNINKKIGLIKIDVEGAELEVLKGAREILSRYKPSLLIEVHGQFLNQFQASIDILEQFLKSYGYKQEQKIEGYSFNSSYFQALFLPK